MISILLLTMTLFQIPKGVTVSNRDCTEILFSEKRGRKRRGKSKNKKKQNGKKKQGDNDSEEESEEGGGGGSSSSNNGCTQSDRTEFNSKVVEMIIVEFHRQRGGAATEDHAKTGHVSESLGWNSALL